MMMKIEKREYIPLKMTLKQALNILNSCYTINKNVKKRMEFKTVEFDTSKIGDWYADFLFENIK